MIKYIKTPWMVSAEKLIEKGVVKKILLTGAPGASKTSFAENMAKEEGVKLFEINMTSGMFPEDILYQTVVEGDQVHRIWSPIWEAFKASQKEKVVLLIDEIDKTKERVEELMLRGLETLTFKTFDKEVSANPDNIIIIATSNNNRSLMAPTYRRFDLRLTAEMPSIEIQKDIIAQNMSVCPVNSGVLKVLQELGSISRKELGVNMSPSYKELSAIADIVWSLRDQKDKDIIPMISGLVNKDFYNDPTPIKEILGFNVVAALKSKFSK